LLVTKNKEPKSENNEINDFLNTSVDNTNSKSINTTLEPTIIKIEFCDESCQNLNSTNNLETDNDVTSNSTIVNISEQVCILIIIFFKLNS